MSHGFELFRLLVVYLRAFQLHLISKEHVEIDRRRYESQVVSVVG